MKENTKLRFGSEVYSWFMAGNFETNKGKLSHWWITGAWAKRIHPLVDIQLPK